MEVGITIKTEDAQLAAIHHQAVQSKATIIIIPGRPQTRVGPHRLFVELSRELAKHNYSSIRFDHRGWGDSSGARLSYEESWRDIKAIDHYIQKQDAKQPVILLGLCDGATAALLSLEKNLSISGLILLNPYLESQSAESQAMLKQHYGAKFKSASQLLSLLKQPHLLPAKLIEFLGHLYQGKKSTSIPVTEQAIQTLKQNKRPLLLTLSSNDLTAAQAKAQLSDWLQSSPDCLTLTEPQGTDHTFSHAGNKELLFKEILHFLSEK